MNIITDINPSTVQIPVAVIQERHYFRGTSNESVLIARCVHGHTGAAEWFPGGDPHSLVVDTFLDIWREHGADGLILYVSDIVVRDLLREQLDLFPGLIVRTVLSGNRLKDAWRDCNHALAEQRQARFRSVADRRAAVGEQQLVIATDASKGRRRLTGLGATGSDGDVLLATTQVSSVLAGEFAAVDAALARWGERAGIFDVLTDSQKVWARLNHEEHFTGPQRSSEEGRCVQRVADLRAAGCTIRVHWVRGHNGHVLNEIADRAAVAARRNAEWNLDQTDIVRRLRIELNHCLRDSPDLVPEERSRHFLPAA